MKFTETKQFITGPAGQIEAMVAEQPTDFERIGVICHPHPLHQGSMNNKVVTTITKAWFGLGLTTVRFNFRGVGESAGHYGDTLGERQDLEAVLQWVKRRYPHRALWLAGFSFGSTIAFQVAKKGGIAHLLSVAPPVSPVNFDGEERIPASTDWVIIHGEEDELIAMAEVNAWHKQLKAQKPALLRTVPGASHFFHGRLLALRDLVVALHPH